MSYEAERFSITTFLKSRNFFQLSPFGLDGESVEISDGAGFMTILPGSAAQRSVGSPGANLHEYVGVLAITFFHGGGKGTRPSRMKADVIIEALTGLKLDETGSLASDGSQIVIDFARAGCPYISGSEQEPPFIRTVVNAPFIRTERK